jgi:hypothetical protein
MCVFRNFKIFSGDNNKKGQKKYFLKCIVNKITRYRVSYRLNSNSFFFWMNEFLILYYPTVSYINLRRKI